MKKPQERECVVFCYLKEDWELWRSQAADGEEFEDTWDEWWDICRDKLRELRTCGTEAGLVRVSFAEFAEHCRQSGVPNNASERTRYVGNKARMQRSR